MWISQSASCAIETHPVDTRLTQPHWRPLFLPVYLLSTRWLCLGAVLHASKKHDCFADFGVILCPSSRVVASPRGIFRSMCVSPPLVRILLQILEIRRWCLSGCTDTVIRLVNRSKQSLFHQRRGSFPRRKEGGREGHECSPNRHQMTTLSDIRRLCSEEMPPPSLTCLPHRLLLSLLVTLPWPRVYRTRCLKPRTRLSVTRSRSTVGR